MYTFIVALDKEKIEREGEYSFDELQDALNELLRICHLEKDEVMQSIVNDIKKAREGMTDKEKQEKADILSDIGDSYGFYVSNRNNDDDVRNMMGHICSRSYFFDNLAGMYWSDNNGVLSDLKQGYIDYLKEHNGKGYRERE